MIVHGMPAAEYHAMERISAHGLMLLERSPAHFMASRLAPRGPTPAQMLGTLVHAAILEPDYYTRRVRVDPGADRRTKAGKDAWSEFAASLPPDALIATAGQSATVDAIRASVLAQPYAAALLADGSPEVTMLWDDAETGVECKARADWVCGSHAVLVDIKTAADASPDAFARAAGSYRYHLQAAWYTLAAEACELGTRAFVFIVVETDPPYSVALYTLDDEAIYIGQVRARHALQQYAECAKSGAWPGYAREIQQLSIPRWAL